MTICRTEMKEFELTWTFDRSFGGQVCKTAGLHACSVHHILSFVHPCRHHALPCQGRKRKNREKNSQNATRFCTFCPLLKQDFPVSTHQSRSVCVGKYTSSCSLRQLAFKGTNQRCSSASGQGNMPIWWWYRCIGGLEAYDDDSCLMSLMSPLPCDGLPCFLWPGLEWSLSFLVLAIQHDLCPPAQV